MRTAGVREARRICGPGSLGAHHLALALANGPATLVSYDERLRDAASARGLFPAADTLASRASWLHAVDVGGRIVKTTQDFFAGPVYSR